MAGILRAAKARAKRSRWSLSIYSPALSVALEVLRSMGYDPSEFVRRAVWSELARRHPEVLRAVEESGLRV